MSQSISSMLEETLNLISIDTTSSNSSIHQLTTSRLLLNELTKKKDTQSDFIKLHDKDVAIDPLLKIISESKGDISAPTYWKSSQNNSNSKYKGQSESNLSKKASDEIVNNKSIQLPPGHKSKQFKKSKGEAYADRLNNKLSSSQHRKQRLDSYSKMY